MLSSMLRFQLLSRFQPLISCRHYFRHIAAIFIIIRHWLSMPFSLSLFCADFATPLSPLIRFSLTMPRCRHCFAIFAITLSFAIDYAITLLLRHAMPLLLLLIADIMLIFAALFSPLFSPLRHYFISLITPYFFAFAAAISLIAITPP